MDWNKYPDTKPVNMQKCIVTYKWFDGTYDVCQEEYNEGGYGHERGFGLWDDKVIAWAALPEPYKGE